MAAVASGAKKRKSWDSFEEDEIDFFEHQPIKTENPESTFEISNTAEAVALMESEYWKRILNKLDGRIALGFYKIGKKYWRDWLCRLIIREELDDSLDYKIDSQRLKSLAAEIVTIFPGEDPTSWYTIARNGNQSGKLPHRLSNLKGVLDSAKVFCRRTQKSFVSESNYDLSEIENLRRGEDNFELYKDKWLAEAKKRMKIWEQWTIEEKFEFFPALKLDSGYQLLEADFARLYPCYGEAFSELWPRLSHSICSFASNRKMKQFSAKYKNELADPGSLPIMALLVLPLLMPPSLTRVKYDNKLWKPSMEQAQNAFVKHLQENESLDNFINAQKKFYAERGLTPRPSVVIQGPILASGNSGQISASSAELKNFVVIGDVVYKFSTPLRAVDACYKILKAIGCVLSYDSRNSWIFLGKFVYGVESEKPSIAVRTLHSDLKMRVSASIKSP